MSKLDDTIRRFVPSRPGEQPPDLIPPFKPGQGPRVANGLAELLAYLGDLTKRIEALEKKVEAHDAPKHEG